MEFAIAIDIKYAWTFLQRSVKFLYSNISDKDGKKGSFTKIG